MVSSEFHPPVSPFFPLSEKWFEKSLKYYIKRLLLNQLLAYTIHGMIKWTYERRCRESSGIMASFRYWMKIALNFLALLLHAPTSTG